MEEEGIGLVLAKATELRFKISNCIHKATTRSTNGLSEQEVTDKDEEEDQEQEEMERLLNISDALESLENQLSSLQVLPSRPLFIHLGFSLKTLIWIALIFGHNVSVCEMGS